MVKELFWNISESFIDEINCAGEICDSSRQIIFVGENLQRVWFSMCIKPMAKSEWYMGFSTKKGTAPTLELLDYVLDTHWGPK